MNLIRTLLPILILLLLAVGSGWYLTRLEANLKAAKTTESTAPRLKGRNVRVTVLNASGTIDHRIVATGVFQGPAGSGTDLVAPELTQFRDGEVIATGTSLVGWVSEDQQQVRMLNSVILTHRSSADGLVTQLETEFLEYEPKRKIATTDRPVTITRPGSRVDAIGMRVDLVAEKTYLLSRVRGTHDQNP